MYKTIQYILIFVILVVPTSAAIADAFDQTVNQLKTLKDELEQIQTNMEDIQTSIAEQLKIEFANHALNAPQNEFESDADYTARRGQLDGIIAQRRAELQKERLPSIHRRHLEIQTEISHLHRRIFFTNDVTATLGHYNANDEYFPITFVANNETIEVRLNITKDNDAPNLKKNWDKVVKTAYISIDPGYRRALIMVRLEYPALWKHGIVWRLKSLVHDLGNYIGIAFSPDGKYFATGSKYYTTSRGTTAINYGATIWKMENGAKFREMDHDDRVLAIAFSPNGKYFATAGGDETTPENVINRSVLGKVILWEMMNGTRISDRLHSRNVKVVKFSLDGTHLATTFSVPPAIFYVSRTPMTGESTLWEVNNGLYYRWSRSHITYGGWTHALTKALTFSPDGRYLVIEEKADTDTYSPNAAILLRTGNGSVVQTFKHKSSVYSVAFSPNGKYLATGNDGSLTLWEVSSGRIVRQIELPDTEALAVTFSLDGEFLAVGTSNSYINVFRVGTGHITFETDIPRVRSIYTGLEVTDLAWHPYGNFISDGNKIYRTFLQSDVVNLTPSTLLSTSSIEPVNANRTFTIDFTVKGVTDLAGWQLEVSFNPKVLSALEVIEGGFLKTGGGNTFFQDGNINNTTGRISGLSTVILGGGVSGAGTLFSINFEAKAAGEGQLQLHNIQFSTSSGERISHEVLIHPVVIEGGSPRADVNQDSVVNIQDLVLVVSNFGKTGTNAADVNEDGVIDVVDLVLVAGAIGGGVAAPSAWGHNLEFTPARTDVQQWLHQARQTNLTDLAFQRGILVLEQLLVALTPKETTLLSNYPNPFNPETWIPYQLAEDADVTVSIYTADGKLVRTLDLGHQPVGIYESRSRAAHWNGRNALGEPVASGVYFYTLTAGEFTATRKMLIMK